MPGQDAPEDLDAVAAIFGCETFMATQMLRRPSPVMLPCPRSVDREELEEVLGKVGLEYVVLDYGAMNAIPDAALLDNVRIESTKLVFTEAGGEPVEIALTDIACAIVGRVEVESTKETRETRFEMDSENNLYYFDEREKSESYDAFTVFDLYGDDAARVRLLEGVCTIEGAEFPKSRRGAGFTRFAKWLRSQNAEVHVDETYLQLGKWDRRVEFDGDGRMLAHGPMRTKEVVGTEEQYTGQDFDDYSVTAWTIWRLGRAAAGTIR